MNSRDTGFLFKFNYFYFCIFVLLLLCCRHAWPADLGQWSVMVQSGESFVPKYASTSKDNKLLATSSGNDIVLWDLNSYRAIRVVEVKGVYALSFSPNGKEIAIGREKSIDILDLTSDTILFSIKANAAALAEEGYTYIRKFKTLAVSYSENGKEIYSVSEDGYAGVSSRETGVSLFVQKPCLTTPKFIGYLMNSYFSELGRSIESSGKFSMACRIGMEDRWVEIVDFRTRSVKRVDIPSIRKLTDQAISDDGKTLVVLDGMHQLQVIDLLKGYVVAKGDCACIYPIYVSGNGERIYAHEDTKYKGQFQFVATGQVNVYDRNINFISKFSSDSHRLQRVGERILLANGEVRDEISGKKYAKLSNHKARLSGFHKIPGEDIVVVYDEDGFLRVFDIKTASQRKVIHLKEFGLKEKEYRYARIASNPKIPQMVAVSFNGKAFVIDIFSEKLYLAAEISSDKDAGVVFSSSGKEIYWRDNDGSIKIGDLLNKDLRVIYKPDDRWDSWAGYKDLTGSPRFSSVDDLVALSSSRLYKNPHARSEDWTDLIDLKSGKVVCKFNRVIGDSLGFTGNGKYLTSFNGGIDDLARWLLFDLNCNAVAEWDLHSRADNESENGALISLIKGREWMVKNRLTGDVLGDGRLSNNITWSVLSTDGKFLFVYLEQGNFEIIDIKKRLSLASVYPLPQGGYLSMIDGGWFETNSYLHSDTVNITNGFEAWGMMEFWDVFHRPDIVQAKLAGEEIGSLIGNLSLESAIRNRPPKVRFDSVQDNISTAHLNLAYTITPDLGGVAEVRVFQNGKLISSDGTYKDATRRAYMPVVASQGEAARYAEANLQRNAKRVEGGGGISSNLRNQLIVRGAPEKKCVPGKAKNPCKGEIKIEVIPGEENTITVVAFNRDNTIQSVPASVSFKSTLPKEEPHLWVIGVGIDQFAGISSLKNAHKDAQDFVCTYAGKEQVSQLGVACSEDGKAKTLFKPQNIHVVDTLFDAQATKSNILAAFDKVAKQAKPGDTFVWFVASHGMMDANSNFGIIAHDTQCLNDNCTDIKGHLTSNEILEASKKIKAMKQLVVLDTCHSGGLDSKLSGLYDARVSLLAKNMGLHLYASAQATEAAQDGKPGTNGTFTAQLLEGIKGAAPKNPEGQITVMTLGDYAKQKTIEATQPKSGTKDARPAQTPVIQHFGQDAGLVAVGRR